LRNNLLDGEKMDRILFQDESMIRDYQAIARTWFPKGQQRIVPTYGKHQGVKLLGTLDYESGEIFVVESDSYNAEVFLSFLHQVLAKYPGQKLVMILDNARIHHANLLQTFLEKNKDRLSLVFLPPYSPNLNLIEEFWGWLKRSCIYNVFYHSVDEIRQRIQTFVAQLNQMPQKVIDRLCCSF